MKMLGKYKLDHFYFIFIFILIFIRLSNEKPNAIFHLCRTIVPSLSNIQNSFGTRLLTNSGSAFQIDANVSSIMDTLGISIELINVVEELQSCDFGDFSVMMMISSMVMASVGFGNKDKLIFFYFLIFIYYLLILSFRNDSAISAMITISSMMTASAGFWK